ncbi:cAMP-dependent protein kinase catalytic subunit beta-like isoform X2 [Acropora muricata]|uniref:cAMP-dependent protein kinase catalytic subunit beta-like isoform X2 n=1 Tax=Acropora muricata TaxID=159855 RepID=UPI0034E49300
MGNTHGRRSSQQRKHRKRPHSIAVDKPEPWPSSKPSEMSRDSRQGSLRRRYSESGNYSYKTPWPLPLSEAVFLPEYDSKQPVKISDFEILATVGKGAFAHVLQVKNKQTEQLFAIKILNKAEIIKENAVQQCKDEANIQVKLGNFPFVVRTWYTWQTKHNLFIVSDFVDGSDLYSLWRQEKRLNDTTVKIYSAELAITLDYLHKSGILYRDLKLENILIDEEGHIKLVDFGLAKLVKPRERTGTICGTLQYMAPEILNGKPYSHEVDWWSLGVVMYTLLVGKNPYPAKQEHCSQLSVVEDTVEIDFPSDLSDDAVSIITQKSPITQETLKSLRRRSIASRMKFPRKVDGHRRDKKPRPLSWASPGSFTVQDKTHMDWLVADLGSLDALNLNGKSQEARRTECLVSP